MSTTENTRLKSKQARENLALREDQEKYKLEINELKIKQNDLANAYQAWKESELAESVTFSVTDFTSSIWNSLSNSDRVLIKDTLMYRHDSVLLRQERPEFLPTGVDVKITVRDGFDVEILSDILYQLQRSIYSDKKLTKCQGLSDAYIGFNPYGYEDEPYAWIVSI